MEKVLEEVDFLVGNKFDYGEKLLNLKSEEIFSEITLSFLSKISEFLLRNPDIRSYPDVATFAFYCRRSSLNSIKRMRSNNSEYRVGRGILFHVTPGNVPVNFAYSLFAGLITGNINIVRVPSKEFQQVDLIVKAIKSALLIEKYKSIFSKRLYLIRYNRDSTATSFFSTLCDVRIIWGGDETIKDIRKTPIPPMSTEVTFSDRYSLAIINAEAYAKHPNKIKVAMDFYNDTYLFDQNACTSPKIIYWLGSATIVEHAQKEFWELMQDIIEEKKYELQPIISVDKLSTFYSQSISLGDIEIVPRVSNKIWRVKNNSINRNIDLFQCSSGYFNEFLISTLDEISPTINRKYQTIGYFGFQRFELLDWFKKSKPQGIDRIVPIGRTMEFSLFWDGHDLVNCFSRVLVVT